MYKNKSEHPTVFTVSLLFFLPGDLVLVDAQSELSIIECHQIVGTMIVLLDFMFLVCCVVRTLRLSYLLYILLTKKSFISEHLLLHLHL